MSSKPSKRRSRRINTIDEDSDKKIEEIIDDDCKSNISTDTERTESEKGSPKKEVVEEKMENKKDKVIIQVIEREKFQITVMETTDIIESQKEDGSSDLEPIVMDCEDPELQFPSETGSEQSSDIEKSPVARCKTRRSQTRNLPTPKTPKAIDFNGDTPAQENLASLNEERVNVTRLSEQPDVVITPPEVVITPPEVVITPPEVVITPPEVVITPPEVVITPPEDKIPEDEAENVSVNSHDQSFESSVSDQTLESNITNASTFVNYTGNDTARNIDITSTSNLDDATANASNFLDSTKEMSYGETLRCLTGRKSLRPLQSDIRARISKSTIELNSKDCLDGIKEYTPITPAPSGLKRKIDRDSPGDDLKRVKTEEKTSPGFFSYLSSPFKSSKLGRSEIPSSTPKLTSFKYHGNAGGADEVSQMNIEGGQSVAEPKKWCSIM